MSTEPSFLDALSPSQFERLVEKLYKEMGYTTELTSPSNDGGRDVIVQSEIIGARQRILVECKRYTRPVGVAIVRTLMGVVSSEKVNKGVLVTTSKFTRGAQKFAEENPRIELIEGAELITLLNEHLGSRWMINIDRLTREVNQNSRK